MSESKKPLFVYAELKKPWKPSTVRTRGELRLRKNGDGAAHFGDEHPGWVRGQLEPDTDDSLKLKHEEKPEFTRVTVTLEDGTEAHAYQYDEPDWLSLPKVKTGLWLKEFEK